MIFGSLSSQFTASLLLVLEMLQHMQHYCEMEHVLLGLKHCHHQISYFSWGINLKSLILLIFVRLLGFIHHVRLDYRRIYCPAGADGGI